MGFHFVAVMTTGFDSGFFGMMVPVLFFALAASVFGGGALLFVGAKFAAKIAGAGYWKSVGVHVVSFWAGVLVGAIIGWGGTLLLSKATEVGALLFGAVFGLAGFAASLVVTWVVIKAMFRTTFGKAVLAWLPTLGQLVLVVPVFIATLMPGLSMARELARRASCKSNVSMIGKGIAIYTASNRDVWPADLDTLIKDGQAPGIFVCPSTSNFPGSGKFDYFYLPADSNAPASTIVLCDYAGNHPSGFRNLLYADLHVGDAMNDQAFQALLAQPQNAAFAKALRAAEAAGGAAGAAGGAAGGAAHRVPPAESGPERTRP
jgi:hypothetical protein